MIEFSALSKSNEVSLAALKSFQEVLYKSRTENGIEAGHDAGGDPGDKEMWMVAWRFWITIGLESTKLQTQEEDMYIPSQEFLTALVQIFPALFPHIKTK